MKLKWPGEICPCKFLGDKGDSRGKQEKGMLMLESQGIGQHSSPSFSVKMKTCLIKSISRERLSRQSFEDATWLFPSFLSQITEDK